MGTKGGKCGSSSSSSSKMMRRRKGHWSVEEDIRLMQAVNKYGEAGWTKLAKAAGLERCGKSCRLRWVNYLRPDVKRGHISNDEEMLIIKLQALYGNRWSLIAAHLPGRSDNEIKNYWRSHIKKKQQHKQHKQQRNTIIDEVETGVQTQGLTSFEEEEEEETMVKVVTCGDPNESMYVMEPNVNIDIRQGLAKEVATSYQCINHGGNLSSTYYDDFDMISLLPYHDGLHNTSSNCYPLHVTCPNGDGCWVEIESISNAYNIPQSMEALPDFQTSSHNVSLWPHDDHLFFNHTYQTIE